jgi:hypothetical protein
MARSPATREALTVAAAAAAGWLALVAVLFQLFPVVSRSAARPALVAAHGPRAAQVWLGAPLVYEEVDRRVQGLAPEERARVARAILEEAARAELAPLLVLAVIHVESRFDPRAVSPVGAVGLMQLMVPTFRAELALSQRGAADPFDPVSNVRAGVRYLARLVATFSDVELALVAYNAGPGALRRHLGAGGVPERLRAYPRDVLRAAVRLAPASLPRPDGLRPERRAFLVAAHVAPARSGALALRGVPRGAPVPAVAAALVAGAASAAAETLAVAVRAEVGEPSRGPSWRDACVRPDLGLPMSRGYRTRSAERVVVLG